MSLVIFDFNRTIYDPDKKKLFSDSIKVLKELQKRGYRLALIAKGSEGRSGLIGELGIGKMFEAIRICSEKTEKDFLEIIAELGERKDRTFSVGDRAKSEIAISKKMGLKTIWLRKGKFADEKPDESEKPDHIVESLAGILEILR